MHPAILLILGRLRSALGTGETPPNSNNNFIVQWYNDNVDRIGRGPWCQMTVTWSHFTTLPNKVIKGRAYTVWAAQDFQAGYLGGTWHWGTSGMRAGDIVYYDWQLTGVRSTDRVDHVGTVERIIGDGTFAVLEGNTSANTLQRMIRDSKYVVGYGRPDWTRSGVKAPSPASAKPAPLPATSGKLFVAELQRVLECTRDGQWGQHTDDTAQMMRSAARGGVFDVRKTQAVINTKVDGAWGPNSDRALTAWVRRFQAALGVTVDGAWGPKTDTAYIAARKRYLNQF